MKETNNINSTFTADRWKTEKLKSDQEKSLNPSARLDKDAFMKLLLTELQYQDPTSPMDSAKMLEQTSQLAGLEMQENTNKTMKLITEQMQNSLAMTAMGTLGKMAHLSSNAVLKDETMAGKKINFALNLKEEAVSGDVEIYDSKMNQIKTMPFGELKSGLNNFSWDGKNKDGEEAPVGEYLVKAKYKTKDGSTKESLLGSYPVEAVRFVDGKAQIKIGGEYMPIEKIKEFTEA